MAECFNGYEIDEKVKEILGYLLQEDHTKNLLAHIRANLDVIDDSFLFKIRELAGELQKSGDLQKKVVAYKIFNILRLIPVVRSRQRKRASITKAGFQVVPVPKEVSNETEIDDLLTKANLCTRSSQLSLAMSFLERARGFSEKIKDDYRLSRCYRAMGIILARVGKYNEALRMHKKELEAAERASDLLSQAKAHGNMASIMLEVAMLDVSVGLEQRWVLKEAQKHNEKALSLYRLIGDRVGEARTLNNRGGIHIHLNELEDALNHFCKARKIKNEIGDMTAVISTLINIATVHLRKGESQKAQQTYKQALDLARETGDNQTVAVALLHYGLFLTKNRVGEHSKAATLLEEAIQLHEKRRSRISDLNHRKSFGREFELAYHALMDIHRRTDAKKSLEVVERHKCSTFIEFMSNPLTATVSTLYRENKGFKFVGRYPVNTISANELLALVQGDTPTALVQYALIFDDLFAFVALPNTLHDVQCIPIPNANREILVKFLIERDGHSGKITGGLLPLLDTYKAAQKGLVYSQDMPQEELVRQAYHRLVNSVPPLLSGLGDAIFEPIEPILRESGAERILFVPSGPLYHFPLQAMSFDDGRKRRYVIDVYDVFSVPSLRTLHVCSQTPDHSKDRLLAIANPDGTLPGTEMEIEAISKLFHNPTCLFGRDATLQALSGSSQRCDIFHAATHAIVDSLSAERSGLLIAKGSFDEHNQGDLYVTHSGEIVSDFSLGASKLLSADSVFAKLHLPPGILVVLSACHTGAILPSLREDYTGLTGAFLIGGAGSVISSFWPVDDFITCLTMWLFYKELRSSSLINSINNAQRKIKQFTAEEASSLLKANGLALEGFTIRDVDFSNPFYWAAFGMFGKPMLYKSNPRKSK